MCYIFNCYILVPGAPQAPKVYVTQRKNAASSKVTLAADFRWSEPDSINGILSHQHVYYWKSSKPHQVSSTTLSSSSRHFILDGLQGNTTYFFQVCDYPGPEVIKHFSCSTQLSMKFKLLITIKMLKNKYFSYFQTLWYSIYRANKCYNANTCWHFNI